MKEKMYVTLPAVMNMMLMTTLSSKILCPFLFVIARLGGPLPKIQNACDQRLLLGLVGGGGGGV